MTPTSPLLAIIAVITAFLTTRLLAFKFHASAEPARVSTIDGLRGYLAFFVFLHHSAIWYFYTHDGFWRLPPSNLYTHLGQSSVAFFFMITGFLFFSKILDSKVKPIDWGRLYVSRAMRLTPLYLFSMAALLAIVAVLSHGQRVESYEQLMREVLTWLGFTVMGAPNINGVETTFIINSGVAWSLPYEWLFYLSLPLISLAMRIRVPLFYLALSIAAIIGFSLIYDKMNSLVIFAVGMASAGFARNAKFKQFAQSTFATLIALASTCAAVVFFRSAHGLLPQLLLSVTFILIACGNSLFGILTNITSRALGETAYSIYLLHGIVLFVTFHFIIGMPAARQMSETAHWVTVLLCTPVIVIVSHYTYLLIELPGMASSAGLTVWLRRAGRRTSAKPN